MKSEFAIWAKVLGLVLILALVIWPGLFNRQPFFSTDTSAYIRGADAGIQQLTGISSSWSMTAPAREEGDDTPPAAGQPDRGVGNAISADDQTVLAGRSIYYGMFLYAGHVAGGFWLTICIQGLVLAYLASMVLKACGLRDAAFLGPSVLLLSMTPAALFASYLMPDMFAATTILCCSLLLVPADRSRAQKLVLFVILLFSLLVHASHVLLAFLLLLLGSIAPLLGFKGFNLRGLPVIAVALALAFAGELIFSAGVARFTGHPPVRPPFLMARVIEDGPGYRYLKEECPRSTLAVCRYLDRLPLSANDFLWAEDQIHGVFSASDPETRRELSREQFQVVLGAVQREPWTLFRAAVANALRQARMIGLPAFQYSRFDRELFVQKFPPEVTRRLKQTAAYQGRMPIRLLSALSYTLASVGVVYILWKVLRGRLNASSIGPGTARLSALVLLGVAANACICGALSVPFDRYQARVVWLVPFIALLVDFKSRPVWWIGVFARVLRRGGPTVFR